MSEIVSRTIVSKNFRARRRAMGISQRALSADMGYSSDTFVRRLERGKVSLPLEYASVVESRLRLQSISDLLTPNRYY